MKGEDYSLNTHEVLDIVAKPCYMVTFEEVSLMDDISDLFPPVAFDEYGVGRCLINYLYEDNYGHWVGLSMRDHPNKMLDGIPSGIIEYFDPYGSFIDEIIEDFDQRAKIEHSSDYPYLLKLIYGSGDDVYFNHFPLQSRKKGINTCGRWAGYYLRYCSEVTVDEFGKSFMDASKDTGISRDKIITKLTNQILKTGDDE